MKLKIKRTCVGHPLQAETLFSAVTEAVEATTGGQALVERVRQSTEDLSREREEAAAKEVSDAKAAADMAEAAYEALRESVRQLDQQASEEIEEGQKIVDAWANRINMAVAAWKKHMIEDMQWQRGYAENQIEQLSANLDSPPENLDVHAQTIVDAYRNGKECEKTFTVLSADWESRLTTAHEKQALEYEKLIEIKKKYEKINKIFSSR